MLRHIRKTSVPRAAFLLREPLRLAIEGAPGRKPVLVNPNVTSFLVPFDTSEAAGSGGLVSPSYDCGLPLDSTCGRRSAVFESIGAGARRWPGRRATRPSSDRMLDS